MKKGIIVICGFLALISACTVNVKDPRILKYEDSASFAIERAVKELKLSSELSSMINKEDRLSISCLESAQSTDGNVIAMVEDVLIHEFVSAGYTVLERDHNAIYKNLIDAGALNNGDISIEEREGLGLFYKIEKDGGFEVVPADKAINYRIKEIGVAYRPDDSSDEKLIREARVIMNVRVEAPYLNKIIYTDTYDASVFDTFEADEMERLVNYGYSFAPSGHQLHNMGKPVYSAHGFTATRASKKGALAFGLAGTAILIYLMSIFDR